MTNARILLMRHAEKTGVAHALRAKLGSYPDPWDAHVFNQMLVLSYLDDGEPKITTLTEPF